MGSLLELDAWDVPMEDIEDVYVIYGPDDVAYLIIKVRHSPPLMIYADGDLSLVVRAMNVIAEEAGIGCTAIAIDPEDFDEDQDRT